MTRDKVALPTTARVCSLPLDRTPPSVSTVLPTVLVPWLLVSRGHHLVKITNDEAQNKQVVDGACVTITAKLCGFSVGNTLTSLDHPPGANRVGSRVWVCVLSYLCETYPSVCRYSIPRSSQSIALKLHCSAANVDERSIRGGSGGKVGKQDAGVLGPSCVL